MRFGVKSLLAAAVLGLSGLAAPAGAQDARLVSYEELLDRVARLEQEMAEVPPAPEAPYAAPATEARYDDGGLYMVYENVFLTPFFSQNTSGVARDNATGSVIVREFNWDLEYSPRFEIGYVDGCTGNGWRARYWHFEHSQQDRGVIPAGVTGSISPSPSAVGIVAIPGDTLQATHSLRMSVLDLEYLRREWSAENAITASVGLRYARIDQHLRGRAVNGGGAVIENLSQHHDFEGIGPTIFAEYLNRFDCSYWGVFVNARGSLLYGDSNSRYDRRFLGGLQENVSDRNGRDLLAVTEMQIGLDYRRPTSSCHEIFLRIALEAQYWHNGGSANNSTTAGGPAVLPFGAAGGNRVIGNNNAQDADLGFVGFTIATGLDW